MARDTDHQFVSELMDLVQQKDDRVAPGPSRAAPSPFRRIFDIVLWSSITNFILLGVFVAGWHSERIRAYALELLSPPTAEAKVNDLPDGRPELQDNELLTRGLQRQLKGPLQITLVTSTEPEAPTAEEPAEVAAVEPEQEAVGAEQDQGDGTGDITVGPEDPAAQLSRSPVLRKAQKNGDVEIGSFATVSLPGSSTECLETAYNLLEDAGAPREKLKVLADSKMITVARICALNGSLVVTCRMDQITISPRRLKPNETCTG